MTEADPARTRFFMLMALRIVAVVLVVFGVMLTIGELTAVSPDIARPLGIALMGIGIVDLFVILPMMTRRWRSPK